MNIFKKDGSLSKRCEVVIFQIYARIDMLENLGRDWKNERIKFYGKWWRNKGRNLDDSAYRRLIDLLWSLSEDYTYGNDAKFQGKEGDYIILPEKMEKYVKWAFNKSKNTSDFLMLFESYIKMRLL